MGVSFNRFWVVDEGDGEQGGPRTIGVITARQPKDGRSWDANIPLAWVSVRTPRNVIPMTNAGT